MTSKTCHNSASAMRRSLCGFVGCLLLLTPALAAGPSQDELDRAGQATDSWLMTNKSYDGARFVALDQITTGNIANLREVCSFDTKVEAPAQSTPLLYQGRFYLSVAQTTIAIDAKTCNELWRHEWVLRGKPISNPNRGVAIKDGKVYRGTPDGYLIALDMDTGKLAWERQVTSAEENHYLSMPAMVVDDRLLYGTAGADFGSQGWFGAFAVVRQENTTAEPTVEGVHTCPGLLGGEEWSSPAFDAAHKQLVFPMVDWCGTAHREAEPPKAAVGQHYYGGKIDQDPMSEGRGVVAALDVQTGQARWKFETPAPVLANVVATSGGLIFAADLGGMFYGLDAANGRALLSRKIGDSAGGGLVSYQSDGKQMIAAVSGPISTFFGGQGTTKLHILALP